MKIKTWVVKAILGFIKGYGGLFIFTLGLVYVIVAGLAIAIILISDKKIEKIYKSNNEKYSKPQPVTNEEVLNNEEADVK